MALDPIAPAVVTTCVGARPYGCVPSYGAYDGETVQDGGEQRGPGRSGIVPLYGTQWEETSRPPRLGGGSRRQGQRRGGGDEGQGLQQQQEQLRPEGGGGGGRRAFACGLFGLRSRFVSASRTDSESRSKAASKSGSGSGSGLNAGFRRSQQLHASRRTPPPTLRLLSPPAGPVRPGVLHGTARVVATKVQGDGGDDNAWWFAAGATTAAATAAVGRGAAADTPDRSRAMARALRNRNPR
ncbi:hypothetical protein PLESTM_000856100 [Pleodorina starrii]|nr:hypothetical protein PLESTM_000856100 [Pleodorina starrii]